MMLPARRADLTGAIQKVNELARSDAESRLRVELLDGSITEGLLVAHSDGHLSLQDSAGQMVYVPTDQIRALSIATRRGGREFVLVAGAIVGITGVLVEAANVPYLRAHSLVTIATWLAIFSFAGIVQLQRRTRLGGWLRAWKPLYDSEGPAGQDRLGG